MKILLPTNPRIWITIVSIFSISFFIAFSRAEKAEQQISELKNRIAELEEEYEEEY